MTSIVDSALLREGYLD